MADFNKALISIDSRLTYSLTILTQSIKSTHKVAYMPDLHIDRKPKNEPKHLNFKYLVNLYLISQGVQIHVN